MRTNGLPQENLSDPASGHAHEKEQNLRSLMRKMRSVLVAYSGGVDSAYLALIATQELGENAVCILGLSPSVSQIQRNEAADIARQFEFNFETIATDEIENPEYAANPSNRCYFCKSELYTKLRTVAAERGIGDVIDGTNADDVGDYRPGRVAAGENNVRSPLVEFGITKSEIRELSKLQGLPSWDKPASPCLSSRIAYGVPVTIERLSKVERGEEILRQFGFREFRVRVHDDIVRIEIAPAEMEKALNKPTADRLAESFSKLGFKFVTLDLHGYRSGAMNEVLKK
ncbi:MAG TPA: ATP-dependent sacrificial sulfur transferase LarE [Pyrinomonadaceae bacterium]|nr:ATP-dependent sacrificial sulfur transferase LarE [Pyrinomonadaceae bacterium]